MHHSGFVSVVGRPNVGKSTLINSLLGKKALIVSNKPQTTRQRIQAVLSLPECQIVFLDTPGIHKPKHLLGENMVNKALDSFKEMDLVLFLVEGHLPPGPGDKFIASYLKDLPCPVVLVLTKIDLATEEGILANKKLYTSLLPLTASFPVSALQQKGLELLQEQVIKHMPPGPRYYPEDTVIDQPEAFIVSEIIREKILHITREEVPHSVAVEISRMGKRDNKDLVDIEALVHVERDSQKKIIIGKKGSLLKEVGSQARREIEGLLGTPVFIDIWVKVNKDWRNKESSLKRLGLWY